jgi:peroxiredoxin
MLGDGNAEWAKAVGLSSDKSAYKMGLRSDRYALIADDGIVKFLVVGGIEATGADAVLAQLAKM